MITTWEKEEGWAKSKNFPCRKEWHKPDSAQYAPIRLKNPSPLLKGASKLMDFKPITIVLRPHKFFNTKPLLKVRDSISVHPN
jgi:hypothetical protein